MVSGNCIEYISGIADRNRIGILISVQICRITCWCVVNMNDDRRFVCKIRAGLPIHLDIAVRSADIDRNMEVTDMIGHFKEVKFFFPVEFF